MGKGKQGGKKAKTFTDLAKLEKYIQIQFANNVWKNQGIKDVVAEEMSQAVFDVVYTHHTPTQYDRRMDEDGLSDVRNVEITYINTVDNSVSVMIENLTEGEDSMQGKFITDLIEEGGTNGWNNPNGAWTEPRPFVEITVERLKENPTRLTEEVKNSLRAIGLTINESI